MNSRLRFLACASLFCALSAPLATNASAQSASPAGEKTLGISAGYVSHNKSGSASVFFQYTLKPLVRLAPEITYVFPNHSLSALDISLDLHMPVRLAPGINFYPLAGLDMNAWRDTGLYVSPDSSSVHDTKLRFGVDLGGGLDFYMTPSLKLNCQAKYTVVKNFNSTYLSLGVGYVF